MAKVKKVPYYSLAPSAMPFTSAKWKGHYGNQGCVPINTQQSVSMDRLAPGEPVPPPKPKPPKPTPEQRKAQKAEEAREKALAAQAKKQQKEKQPEQPKSTEPEAEECEKPPVFDLLDIPDAMEKMKWPVSAALAKKWFSSPKNIYNDDPNSVLPIDRTTITLDWVLKFGSVKDKYNKLLSESIYSKIAIDEAKKHVRKQLNEFFVNQNSTNLSFNTTNAINDPRQFHIDWQFQLISITGLNTTNGFNPNDLTGSLANFAIYAAIGNVITTGDQYFKYNKENGTKSYCFAATSEITHVYVYVKDNYSFNDKKGYDASQYLGHWNKKGIVTSSGGVISELTNNKHFQTEFGNSKITEMDWNDVAKGLNKPIDTRQGVFRKFRESDVYFPIYNRDYNAWREKHNRGGDFFIYSKPKYIKLKTPIKFKLEEICRNPEKM